MYANLLTIVLIVQDIMILQLNVSGLILNVKLKQVLSTIVIKLVLIKLNGGRIMMIVLMINTNTLLC